jgi:1-acyl-sn-glycerol-3-phosphate acyltransferase
MRIPLLGPHTPRRGTALTRVLGRWVLGAMGWRFEGEVPDVPRCVVVVAPHTSNWDFVVGLAALLALGFRGRFLGKDGLFRPPFGGLLRWTGGIPVDRGAPEGVVEGAVRALQEGESFLAIAPEGTRKAVDRWKTGFHRIAREAQVGIWPVAFDYRTRTVRFWPLFTPTADLAGDLAYLRSLYEAGMARRPANYGA